MLAQPRLDNNINGTGTTGLLVSLLLVGQTPNEKLPISRSIEYLCDHIKTSCKIFFPSPKGLRSVRSYIWSVGRLRVWMRIEFWCCYYHIWFEITHYMTLRVCVF